MSEHKAGETVEITIGTKTLIIEPVAFGKLKKVIKIISEASTSFDSKTIADDFLVIVPKLVEKYVEEFIPLLFDPTKHTFLTKEWIDENLTIPAAKKIVMTAIAVNGLGDFFVKTAKAPAPTSVEASSGTIPTHSESSGSTTSLDSLTVGGPRTLTN